jgi:hypothetical protein
MGMSSGCGKAAPALLTKKGAWVAIADGAMADGYTHALPNPDPAPVMIKGPDGTTVSRGFYMWVPANYDPSKPARIIYEGAGCTSDSKVDSAGADIGASSGWPYQTYDGANNEVTIQVGLQYDPARGGCYDDQNPMSNDFAFFPYLHQWVEQNFCVDLARQFFSGYSSGSWLANQMTCEFPDVLRGVVEATGGEPPQPTCMTNKPVAALFLHDVNDTINSFAGILPACTRVLGNNGCSTTSCSNPADTTVTTVYNAPTFAGSDGAPSSLKCRQFNGCPQNYPVVFCETTIPGDDLAHHFIPDIGKPWIPKLFFDFISKF